MGMSPFDGPDVDITPEEAARRLDTEELVLVDVREDYEYDAGHVPGSVHIEIERVASSASKLPSDRPIAFLCRAGIRSAMVARAYRASGYDAYTVTGGFSAWVEAGCPTEPDDAIVAPH